jgi:Ca-activated chloride channel family protein
MNNLTLNQKKFKTGLLLFILLRMACNLSAQEAAGTDKSLSPYFLVLSNNPETDQLPLKNTSANVNIVGVIADVTVHQVYKNEGKNALEAIYTFPASTNAAVYAMEMRIGDRKIIAKIKEKQQARQEYEQAKSEGKRTSLLEQQRPNVFQMNVANIMPGDEIEVSMKYTEMLVPEGGTYKFIYPTVVGPRYTGENTNSASAQFTHTPYQQEGNSPFYNFDIHVNLSTGMAIQNILSTSHKINVKYPQTSIAQIGLDQSETNGGNRDFVLEYQLAGKRVESGLMLYENGDENFFLMMVQPPKTITKEDIPPREYIFIVDVSGSMSGFPLSISKSLIRNLVSNLLPDDKFNIMAFAGNSGWLAEESLPANAANIEKGIQFIDRREGGGGTNLLSALQKALTFPRKDDNLSRSFVILTDGYVDVEKEAFDLIRNNNDKANTFAFGIGSSVNRFLIEGMAHAGMGEPFVVLNEAEASKEAEKFRNYINNPILTQVKQTYSGFDTYDVEPLTIPDVFAERPVIVYGKYRGELKGNITIKGSSGNKKYTKTFKVSDVKPDPKNVALRYLWARKKIQMLDDYNNLRSDDARVKEVTDLGLQYNLLTAYTSFIAVEEDVKANENGNIKTVDQPLPLPEGVSNSAIGFDLEVEAEDMSFTFYKTITIENVISEAVKNRILMKIEENTLNKLNKYLTSSNSTIEEIEVTVDASGKVKNITIKGSAVSDELKKSITNCINKWKFGQYNLKKDWKFQIKF